MQKLTFSSCGRQLSIKPNQQIIECPYCGNEYQLQDLLDALLNCPLCGSSDHVLKTASIPKDHFLYRKLGFDLDGFPFREDDDDDDDDDESGNKALAGFIWLLIIIPLLLLQMDVIELADLTWESLIGIGLFIVLVMGFIIYAINRTQQDKMKKESTENFKRVLRKLNQEQYSRLKPIYEKLYYCHKDQVIFIPDTGDHAKPEHMRAYLGKYAQMNNA